MKVSIPVRVGLLTAIRTLINSIFRMAYAMQPLLATGMGIKLEDLAMALSVRSLLGIFAPFLAIFTETQGRKKGMGLGMVLFIFGVGLIAILQSFMSFVVGSSLVVIGNTLFIPSMQSYISDHIPYEKRGRYLAITELSWSMGFIVGAPALGYLLTRFDWVAPHIAVTALGLVLFALFFLLIPEEHKSVAKQPLLSNLQLAFRTAPVISGVFASISATSANELINVVFGEWIKDSFGLAFATLTIASVVIGGSELGSELLSAVMLDRVSKQKTMIVALGINALVVSFLPLTQASFALALVSLALIFITYEVFLISLITLMSEQLPAARATVMAIIVATFSCGRMIGSLFGVRFYLTGFWVTCLAAIICDLFGVWMVTRIKKDPNRNAVRVEG